MCWRNLRGVLRRLGPRRTHGSYIHEITFAPEGRTVAVWYNDATVLFWEAGSPGSSGRKKG